jgi:hypothetical protein
VLRFRPLLSLVALALVAALPLTSQAAPTCTAPETEGPQTNAVCGGRVVASPLQSVSFLQYGTEYKPVLDAIERIAPEIMMVDTLGNVIGNPDLKSKGGNQIYVVRVTDESVTTPKRQVAISLSVHGIESAGREGGIRYLEDLARWWKTDPERLLYSGDEGLPLKQILAETEIWISVVNVDGWAAGDLGEGGTFQRGNSSGVDLNREFPTIGWTKRSYTPLSEPESIGWDALVSSLPRLTTATDIHGELTSKNNAFSDIMYPAGQWNPTRQAQELQFAEHMKRTVERKFVEEGVVIQQLFDEVPEERGPMKAAHFATAYDVVGYDDAGFMGDYFVSKGAVELDVENFLSHQVPANVWVPAVEQAHVAAVKGNMESTIVESMITHNVTPEIDLGTVAFVRDPARVRSDDANGFGFTPEAGENPKPYSVNRMRYFYDLGRTVNTTENQLVTPLASAGVTLRDLTAYDSIVLADATMPADVQGRTFTEEAYLTALSNFVKGGGQLVLTDSAINLIPKLTELAATTIKTGKTNAGHIDFGTLDHLWEQDLAPGASQTYFEVPLGYTASNQAPHWGIDRAAWEAAGGATVGTVTAGGSTFTALGELPVGEGSIAIFGAVLPTQTETNPHLFGLADYGVTVAGGQVLNRILGYRAE